MEKVLKLNIRMENGYAYVIDGKNYILKMRRYGPEQYGRPEKILKLDIKRDPGYLYFVDKNGYVVRVKIQGAK